MNLAGIPTKMETHQKQNGNPPQTAKTKWKHTNTMETHQQKQNGNPPQNGNTEKQNGNTNRVKWKPTNKMETQMETQNRQNGNTKSKMETLKAKWNRQLPLIYGGTPMSLCIGAPLYIGVPLYIDVYI